MMTGIRWFTLRLFFSLLLFPVVAALALWLMHSLLFRGVFFNDIAILLVLWILLFGMSHVILSRIGLHRYTVLDTEGWYFFRQSDEYMLAEIFDQFQKVLRSGLLPLKKLQELEDRLLRRYFTYYASRIEEKYFRDRLRRCLRRGIHSQRAYETLKAYLVQQPQLDAELVELGEELHEFHPDDSQIVEYMVEKYIQDGIVHSGAAYFYRQALEKGGPHTEKIVELCLPLVMKHQRKDDFAAWVLIHAAEKSPEITEQCDHLIWQIHRQFELIKKKGALAERIAALVRRFPPDKVQKWQKAAEAAAERQWRMRVSRFLYRLSQKGREGIELVKFYRTYVYSALGTLAAVLIIWLFLPGGQEVSTSESVQKAADVAPGRKLFSLQVAATRNGRAARREVDRLKKLGYDAYLIKPRKRGGWYRIRVGKFVTKRQAQQTGQQMKQKKIIREYFLVNYRTK